MKPASVVRIMPQSYAGLACLFPVRSLCLGGYDDGDLILVRGVPGECLSDLALGGALEGVGFGHQFIEGGLGR